MKDLTNKKHWYIDPVEVRLPALLDGSTVSKETIG